MKPSPTPLAVATPHPDSPQAWADAYLKHRIGDLIEGKATRDQIVRDASAFVRKIFE